MNATYDQIQSLISNNETFNGNSSSAKRLNYVPRETGRLYDDSSLRAWEDSLNGHNDFYVVYSYGTPMMVHALGTAGEIEPWINPNKYSTTTSRLQNIIRRIWG